MTVANDNAPGQVVLSGSLDALDKTEADRAGARHARDPPRRRRRVPLARDGAVRRAVPRGARRGRARRARLHRLLRRERRAVHRRARGARQRPRPPRALARDRDRHARGRRAVASSRSAPARSSPAWASASSRASRSTPPPKDSSMPSATLPPELHQIAREAARTGRRPAPPRTATILGLGHYLPSEVVPNGAIAEHIGRRRRVDRQAHGHPRPPPRRPERAHERPRRVRRPARAAGRGHRGRSTSTT